MALPVGEHVIEGTLSGLEPKTNGWFKFSITQPGMQYPDKVDTQKQDIIQQATALMGQQVSALVAVTDSGTPNPNRPGTNYLNRYLNAIGPPGTYGPGAAGGNASMPGTGAAPAAQQPVRMGGGEDPAKALRIARMNAASHAVGMLAAGKLPPGQETMVGLVEVAEAWVAYTLLGPARFGVAAFNEPQAQPQTGANPAAAGGSEDRNWGSDPCPDCGAGPGELHLDGCIPF